MTVPDTLFTTSSIVAVEKEDTIEFLWRETSNIRCLPIEVLLSDKMRRMKIDAYSENITKNVLNDLNILNYKFIIDKKRTTPQRIVYKLEYKIYVDQELIGTFCDKHKVQTIDLRDRKIFYSTMNHFESIFGEANIYSWGNGGKIVSRCLANYVCWESGKYRIFMRNEIAHTCMPTDEKKQFIFIVIEKI